MTPEPHHWMNADGTCHAGDLFEHGTPSLAVYALEQIDAALEAAAVAIEDELICGCIEAETPTSKPHPFCKAAQLATRLVRAQKRATT